MTTPKVTIGETELTSGQVILLRAAVQTLLEVMERASTVSLTATRLREINELLSN